MNKHQMPTKLAPSITHKDKLTIQNNMIVKGNGLLIPEPFRNKIIEILHETHLGTTKTKQLARDMAFWPNINTNNNKSRTMQPLSETHTPTTQRPTN